MSRPPDALLPPPDGQWWQTAGGMAFACPACATPHVAAPVVCYGGPGWLVAWHCPTSARALVQVTRPEEVPRWGAVLGPWLPYRATRGTGPLAVS